MILSGLALKSHAAHCWCRRGFSWLLASLEEIERTLCGFRKRHAAVLNAAALSAHGDLGHADNPSLPPFHEQCPHLLFHSFSVCRQPRHLPAGLRRHEAVTRIQHMPTGTDLSVVRFYEESEAGPTEDYQVVCTANWAPPMRCGSTASWGQPGAARCGGNSLPNFPPTA